MTMTIQLNEDCRPFLSELADFIQCDVSVLNQYYRDFTHPDRWGGGTVEPAVGQLLYILTRFLAPINAFEIGTNFGYSTYCIARALKDNKVGRLTTVEIDPEYSMTAQETLKSMPNVEYLIGDSRYIIEPLLRESYFIPDLVFIDSDHTYETTKFEVETCCKYISKGGVILLHDIFSEGVSKYLEEFNYSDFKKHFIPTQPNTGFGILMHVPPSSS